MTDNEYRVKLWRICGIGLVSSILLMSSCTASIIYQERAFKEAAVTKGMSANGIACAWNSHSSSTPSCVLLAKEGK